MLLVEGGERGPALARVLGADQRREMIGAIAVALEARDQRGQPLVHAVGADEIEPIDAAALRLGLRERRPAALDRLLHQHQQMPGQRAPWRRDHRVLLRIDRRRRGVDLDDEQLAHDFEVADPERFRRVVGAGDPHAQKVRAHERGRRRDQRIGGRISALAARAPAIGEHVGVEQIGGAGARAVMEGRAHHPIGQLLPGDLALAHRLQPAASRLRQHRVGGNADLGAGLPTAAPARGARRSARPGWRG